MKCRFPETRLALYIEGDLSARQTRATARHLQTCRECQGAAAELRAGLETLKALAQPNFNAADFDVLRQRAIDGLRAIEASPSRALRLERAVISGFHGRRALAGAAAVAAIALWMLAAPQRLPIEAPIVPAAATSAVAAMDRTVMTIPDAPDKTPAIALPDRPVAPAGERPAIPSSETADMPQPLALLSEERAAEPPQPLLVKLFTDDPNVVIYWLVEPQGDPDASSSF